MTTTYTHKSGIISLDGNGIVYYRATADEMNDISDLKAILDLMETATKGNPLLIMMLLNEHQFLMTKEARNFFNEYEKAKELIRAEAVVTNSLSNGILYSLLDRLHQPVFPFKSFTNEDEAVKWLLSQR
ncbi:MAG: hypothetical protein H6601_11600 [Flavobacteriales bacterium]|nr:hypothetical protein [Flavobacteriales bacterium]